MAVYEERFKDNRLSQCFLWHNMRSIRRRWPKQLNFLGSRLHPADLIDNVLVVDQFAAFHNRESTVA